MDEPLVSIIMPAYNAAETLKQTYDDLPMDIVDEIILDDDASTDATAQIAQELGIENILIHDRNTGYGGNQKSCYNKAMSLGADIVIMVHPDYQYTPKLIRAMASLIAEDVFDCVLGSRILGVGALKGGMPVYKYMANRALTFIQNLLVGYKLAEYHTGYRAFSKELLNSIPIENNSDDFIFDNQMLLQIISYGFHVGEVTCPTSYTKEASSIGGLSAVRYGLGVLFESVLYKLDKLGLIETRYRK